MTEVSPWWVPSRRWPPRRPAGQRPETLPVWNVRRTREVLGLPRATNPVCIVPIGWAEGRYGPTTRPAIGEVVHLGRYGNRPFLT